MISNSPLSRERRQTRNRRGKCCCFIFNSSSHDSYSQEAKQASRQAGSAMFRYLDLMILSAKQARYLDLSPGKRGLSSGQLGDKAADKFHKIPLIFLNMYLYTCTQKHSHVHTWKCRHKWTYTHENVDTDTNPYKCKHTCSEMSTYNICHIYIMRAYIYTDLILEIMSPSLEMALLQGFSFCVKKLKIIWNHSEGFQASQIRVMAAERF